jgi:hypothetical protein
LEVLWCNLPPEWVYVAWVSELVKDDVDIVFTETLTVQEVLHGEDVKTHLLALVNHLLPQHVVILRDWSLQGARLQ